MAKRNCHEEEGEIRFDYDMAIAEPFKTTARPRKVDLWPLFEGARRKSRCSSSGARKATSSPRRPRRRCNRCARHKLAVVPGVGHAPELNEPEAVAAIDEFLAQFDR